MRWKIKLYLTSSGKRHKQQVVRVLVSTISEIAKTADLDVVIDKLKTHAFGNDDYHFSDKKFASAIGHLMLQRLLSEANLDPGVWQTLHRGPYGKIQVHAAVDFNISHSADKVVAVFAEQQLAGIDIEKIRGFEWHECSDLFTAADWDIVCTSDDPEKMFFEFWTKKESLLKAYGLGLQIPMDQVTLHHHIGRIENTSMTGYFKEVKIPGYVCYVCTQSEVFDFQIGSFTL
jgi:phosphopantetheinyl transferase